MVAGLIAAFSHVDLERGGFFSPQRAKSFLKKNIFKIRPRTHPFIKNRQDSLDLGCHQQHLPLEPFFDTLWGPQMFCASVVMR